MAQFRPVPAFEGAFVAGCEGCVLRVYDDEEPWKILQPGDRVIGTLTAGWGHTGPELEIGMVVTLQMALDWRAEDMNHAAHLVCAKLSQPALDRLSNHQYGAMADFVFNLGLAGTTIWQDIEANRLGDVPAQMALFDHAKVNGKLVIVPGLDHRRTAEVNLWRTPDIPADHPDPVRAQADVIAASVAPVQAAGAAVAPPSSVTRALDTPPRPVGAPMAHRGPFQAACAAAMGCATTLAANAPDVLAKAKDTVDFVATVVTAQADKAPKLASAVAFLGYAGVAVGLAVPIAMALKRWADTHQPGGVTA